MRICWTFARVGIAIVIGIAMHIVRTNTMVYLMALIITSCMFITITRTVTE